MGPEMRRCLVAVARRLEGSRQEAQIVLGEMLEVPRADVDDES